MAISKSKPIPDELKAVLLKFEAWLYNNIKLCNSTAALYVGFIRRCYPSIGLDPTPERLMEYVVEMRRANTPNNSVCATITALERFSAFLGRPINLTRPPKIKTTVAHTLSEGEIAVFLHSAKTLRDKAILALLAYTGMRNNELCHIMIRDVDIAGGLIRVEVGKFNKERIVGVAGECVAVLVEYMKGRKNSPDDLLFTTVRNKQPLEPQDVRKLVRVTAKRAGFDRRIWPHLFRHSLATNMLERGAHLLTIRDQLGHVWIESTMVYVHRSKKGHSNDYRQHAPSYL